MPQLGLIDEAFWAIENDQVAVHIGGVGVFAGRVPSQRQFAEWCDGATARHPRLRRRIHRPLLGLTRSTWVPDDHFDVDVHLRRLALPRPGSDRQLDELVGQVMSERLDPDRALWEMSVVEGLSEGRWAVVLKVHHSVLDGLTGMDLLTELLDPLPDPDSPHPVRARRPTPSLHADRGHADPVHAGRGRRPLATARAAVGEVRGLLEFVPALRPTAPNSLNGRLHATRAYRTVDVPLAAVHAVQHRSGATVNDVALAMTTHAFRRLLQERGESAGPRSVRCLVPVSTREHALSPDAANHVSALLVDLPVEQSDPAAALTAVVARTRQRKAGHEAATGERGIALASWLPAPAVQAFLRMTRRVPQRLVTTLVTNVPGPDRSLALLGRRLLAFYPYLPVAEHIRIAVALSSYDDRLAFGVTADRASVPDLDVFVAGLTEGLDDLRVGTGPGRFGA